MLSSRTILTLIVGFIAYRYATSPKIKIPSPVVTTEYGKVRGIVSLSRGGREYYEYLAIPYAKAERFEISVEPDSWGGIRDASEFGSVCLHMDMLGGNIHGEEDCLFLNVFVPKEKKDNQLLNVAVFVHGGHFTEGASNSHRADYLMDEDIVLVTINYRLGALGFLNTDDGVVRGNMGLKDQTMALKWVQRNIADFNGNPNQVTLIGESAGSACVHYHMVSPMSKGLFHKAISQSGIALSPWTIMLNPKEQSRRLGRRMDCPTENSKEMVDCLKSKFSHDIAASQIEILQALRDPMSVYVPSIEKIIDKDTFLSSKPEVILKSGKFNKVPWLTGLNSEEGLISSTAIIRDETVLKTIEEDWEEWLPKILYYSPDKDASSKIRDYYFGNHEGLQTMEKLPNHTNLISDRHFFTGFDQSVKLHSAHSPVYVYYYTYPGEFTLANILLAVKGKLPVIIEILSYLAITWVKSTFLGIEPPRYGVCHADELPLILAMPGLVYIDTKHKDYQMSKEMVTLWVDFIKDEKSLEFRGQKWLPVSKTNTKYLLIDRKSGLVDPPFGERLKFWEKLNLKDRV